MTIRRYVSTNMRHPEGMTIELAFGDDGPVQAWWKHDSGTMTRVSMEELVEQGYYRLEEREEFTDAHFNLLVKMLSEAQFLTEEEMEALRRALDFIEEKRKRP